MLKRLAVAIGLVALFLPACSSGSDADSEATLTDYHIALDPATGSAGELTFGITNDAEQTHEFVVFKTDLPPDQLPTNEEGDVDEEGEGVEAIDEVEDIEGGADAELTVNLDAGSYVVICNLPGHYRQGMHAAFTVS
jgi:uncharacterized cupredoxin-like copper-binding protein